MTSPALEDGRAIAARIAGVAYLLSVVTVVAITYGLVTPLVADLPPAEVARNVLAHETRFRIGVVGYVLCGLWTFVVSAALYVVLRTVHPLGALVATLGRLVLGLVWLVIYMNLFTALRLLTQPEQARAWPPDLLPVMARLYLSGWDQYYVGLLFWCLASTMAAWLWLKSRYVPRLLAVFGLVASSWGAACTMAYMVIPSFASVVHPDLFDVPMLLFEIALSLRLAWQGLDRPGIDRLAISPG